VKRYTILVFIYLISAFAVLGQSYQGNHTQQIKPAKAAGCAPPTTTSFLELNNVRAMVHTAGNLWQIPGQNFSQYEVPKNSGIMALFTAALWLGGTDVNNQLKLAALRYRNGQDYWTGPLSQVLAETSYEECDKYDRHFISSKDEIREFNAWFEAGLADQQNGTNTQAALFPNYQVPEIIKTWPAHGNVSLGQDYYLAPFYDFNDDGHYDWRDGDYPWYDIKQDKQCNVDRDVSLYGDKNFWWVMNDKGNIHTETGADPIGMEIRAQAFAFASNDEVNNMTFYNYVLINRGTQTLYNTYFGFFTDGALGDPYDDYVGCDVMRGLGYYYNGDNFDGDNSGYKGYGYSPPAVGVDFFEGPYQDDDGIDNAYGIGLNEALNGIGYGDGIIDNERFGMRRFLYYSNTTNGANISQTDPIASSDYYNYLRGYWKDGSKFVYGGSGHISDPEADPNTPCDFIFPGTSDVMGWGTGGIIKPNWTEQTANNTPNDRRFVESAGPFVLKPGAVNNITVGVVWARSNGGDPFTSVESLRRADDKAQALFENCFKVMDAPHAPTLEIQELNNELILYLSNPINSNNYQEKYEENDPFIVSSNPNVDKTFRFQGYQIFQLANNQVALSDLGNPIKSRLVAQCDIKDNVSRIINFEFDEELGFSVPKERVNGENKGIRHSFRVTNDLFAQGQSKLVNFKKYYYMAVSYAYNNYETYNPNDPLSLNGQKMPYIASRKSAMGEVKVMEGVPHNPMPEADGTYQQISYGSTPRITRLDGYGNGNRSLEFTEVTLNTILNTGFMEDPEYEYGQGPVNIKVVDPLNLKSGYFECRFRNYTPTAPGNAADTASWVIYRYDSKGGTIQDSVSSEVTISGDNEQIIPAWGISVQIHQENYYFPSGSGNITAKTTDMIESSMTFADSSKRWLTGVKDNDAFFPTNWIRSGEYIPVTDINNAAYDCNPNVPPYLNPCNYPDESGVDPNQNYEGVLEGIIAPHRLTGYEADYMPLAYCGTFSGSSRQNASISFLPSVNIVITSDKSKWTRCPVVELGRTAGLNVGAAVPGGLRKSPSVDKFGNPDGTGTGMGWFPGYAVDLESGARLYMAFGENSFLGGENGADMVWNPTSNFVSNVGTPLMGGMHPVYVFSYNQKSINSYNSSFDFPAYTPGVSDVDANNEAYQKYLQVELNNTQAKRDLYGSLTWISYPIVTPGQTLLSTDVTIKLRINKEYKNFTATGANGGKPMYGWSMDEIATEVGSHDALKEGLKLINVVPNPYFAYSDYERTKLDTKVKITNLPERCTITIYNAQGKRLRQFKKDSPITYQDWNLCNEANIPVSGGVYLIHVDVPGVGEVVLKSFVAMRIPDLENL
jgi:hypothetical protein